MKKISSEIIQPLGYFSRRRLINESLKRLVDSANSDKLQEKSTTRRLDMRINKPFNSANSDKTQRKSTTRRLNTHTNKPFNSVNSDKLQEKSTPRRLDTYKNKPFNSVNSEKSQEKSTPRRVVFYVKKLFCSIGFNKIAACLIAAAAAALIINPAAYTASVSEGFRLFTNSVLPSLFPFLVLSKAFLSLGGFDGAEKIAGKIFEKCYGVPSAGVGIFLTALVGGYPVGAKTTADLYLNGFLTKKEAKTAAAFSSVASPSFVLGFVGGLTGFPYAALILACHWLSAILTGLFFKAKEKSEITFKKNQKSRGGVPRENVKNSSLNIDKKRAFVSRNYAASIDNNTAEKRASIPRENIKNLCVNIDKKDGSIPRENPKNSSLNSDKKHASVPRENPKNLLADTITSAISTALLVGGFVALFNMLSEMFFRSPIFSFLSAPLSILAENEKIPNALLGFIEMTRGVSEVAKSGIPINFSVPLICFLISFGGLSVTLQSLAFLKSAGVTFFGYIKIKAVQAIFAALFSTAAMLILKLF